MRLHFHGGAKSVTGANYLLEVGHTKILIDCGLQQGSRYSERQNFEPFPYDPREIEALFVSHAHIDHVGRIPMLYRQGFRGKIYSTPPTKDCAEFLLLDSEHILAREAEEDGREAPYDASDVTAVMGLWEKRRYHEEMQVRDIRIQFWDAGHVLGSASTMVFAEGKRILFSGDLGNVDSPFIVSKEYPKEADYVLTESVYGGRIHEDVESRKEKMRQCIIETARAGGVLMIPAFALERTQQLLFELNDLVENKKIPFLPVFLDSPLAIKLTSVYQKYSRDSMYFNAEAMNLIRGGDALFDFPGLRTTLTTRESRDIAHVPPPKVVIAGAGMSNGGRILHHEKIYLSDSQSTILFLGYQARGSLGRQIFDGAEEVRILGEKVPVRCRVEAIGGYSAHADQNELIHWLSGFRGSVKKVFVTQGEEEEANALAVRAREEFGLQVEVPEAQSSIEL